MHLRTCLSSVGIAFVALVAVVMDRFALLIALFAFVVSGGCGDTGAQGTVNTPVVAVAATVSATLAVGTSPSGIAVDPSTNKIYVPQSPGPGSCLGVPPLGNITVIDGATNASTALPAGFLPVALTVDSQNHTAYAVSWPLLNIQNANCNVPPILTIVDGASLTSSHVVLPPTYMKPTAIAVNPVTGKIYVATRCCNNVIAVIDGATQSLITLIDPSEVQPAALAVNPTTNKVYLINSGSNSVSVIDGAANSISTVASPKATAPNAVAVNPTTNEIYVANEASNNVSVIDGATDSITIVVDPSAIGPHALAVNLTTDRIYVANSGSNSVTVIDGATNSVATVAVGISPVALAVDAETNMVYVANAGNSQTGNPGSVTVIDCATNATTTLTDPKALSPSAVAVNPVTNKIYVANSGSDNVTVIDGAHH